MSHSNRNLSKPWLSFHRVKTWYFLREKSKSFPFFNINKNHVRITSTGLQKCDDVLDMWLFWKASQTFQIISNQWNALYLTFRGNCL